MRAAMVVPFVVLCLLGSRGVAQDTRGELPRMVARGDSAWERGDHEGAAAAYSSVVRVDSAFSTRALFRLGTMHAWAGRHDAAIACHRLYVRLEPQDLEGRVALGRTFAWAARYTESIAQYDSVLAQRDDYREAGLGKATTLAWWGRLDDAIATMERWQQRLPRDLEIALARAQFLSWAGRLDDALALYDSLATSGAASGATSGATGADEAEKGRARVLAWRGDLDLAELRWRAYLRTHESDVAAWVGLAQVLRWMGRPFAARDALDRALTLAPDDRDAREQMRWVRAETAPQASTVWVLAEDSEENSVLQQEVGGALALSGNVRINAAARTKLIGAAAVTGGARSTSAVLSAQWQPAGTAWTLRGEVGVVDFPALSNAATTHGRFAARAQTRIGSRWRAGAGVTREPLDEVRSTLDNAVLFSGADADVSVALRPQLSLGLGANAGAARGRGVDTERRGGVVALRWTMARGFSAALTHRETAWSEPAFGVFFAPQRFALTETSLSWERRRDLGFVAGGDVGAGSQAVRFDGGATTSSLASRIALRAGYRPQPGREILLGGTFATVAGAGAITVSEYSYAALTLTARWTF